MKKVISLILVMMIVVGTGTSSFAKGNEKQDEIIIYDDERIEELFDKMLHESALYAVENMQETKKEKAYSVKLECRKSRNDIELELKKLGVVEL